mgnify:CR=1
METGNWQAPHPSELLARKIDGFVQLTISRFRPGSFPTSWAAKEEVHSLLIIHRVSGESLPSHNSHCTIADLFQH